MIWASTGLHDPDARYGAHVYNSALVGGALGLLTGLAVPFLMSEPLALIGLIPAGIMLGVIFGALSGTLSGSFANWVHRKTDKEYCQQHGGQISSEAAPSASPDESSP